MRKYFTGALAAGIVVTVISVAAGAAAQRYVSTCLRSNFLGPSCFGHLEVDVGGAVIPKKLPAHELAPVGFQIHGKIANENGGHPPALREAIVDIAKGVKVDTTGLPACGLRRLESRGVAAARRKCREAVVGSGVAHIGFASSETIIEAPLTLFNGGTTGGETRLFIHSAITVPSLMPLVGAGKISRRHDGLTSVWRIPSILEGDGSLIDFRFRVSRRFKSGGIERSYLAARCTGDGLQVNVPRLLFRNEAEAPGVAANTMMTGGFIVPCSSTQ